MRSILIAGNWKMNMDRAGSIDLVRGIVASNKNGSTVEILVCPPFVYLDAVLVEAGGTNVQVGAQNMSSRDAGAYTGEISARMLRDIGCSHVILGHSERRQYFGETDESVNAKVRQALAFGLTPVVCIGESLVEREGGEAKSVVETQLDGASKDLNADQASQLVWAYEPVWAIGTGVTASPDQAQEMHAFIRAWLASRFGDEVAQRVRILYGGSMKPENAESLLACEDIDGGLIGGASLKPETFSALISTGTQSGD